MMLSDDEEVRTENDKEELDYESDDEDEEEPVEWTVDNEMGFLRALSALKSKDPRIYDRDTDFFQKTDVFRSTEIDIGKGKEVKKASKGNNQPAGIVLNDKKLGTARNDNDKKPKKMTLRDYEQTLLLEHGGKFNDESDSFDSPQTSSYFDDQQMLKQAFKEALESEDSDGGTDLLRPRIKTIKEKKQEELDYYEWLKTENSSLEVHDENLEKLKRRWKRDDELDENEKFLRDYLLNKQHDVEANHGSDEDQIPTYEEIIREDEEDDRVDAFERSYNFRFEDPDQEFIKQHPRLVENSLRKPESRRKCKRAEKRALEKQEGRTSLTAKTGKFRYRTVPQNDFGLTLDEILFTDDRILNKWSPITKVCMYRTDEEERRDIEYFAKKAQNIERKRKLLTMELTPEGKEDKMVGESDNVVTSIHQQVEDISPMKKRKKKRKLKTNANEGETQDNAIKLIKSGMKITDMAQEESQQYTDLSAASKLNETMETSGLSMEGNQIVTNKKSKHSGKKKRQRQRQKQMNTSRGATITDLSIERLRSYGVSVKKLKRLQYNKRGDERFEGT